MIRKVFILVLTIGLCGGALKAQTLESKFGLDSMQTRVNASIYTEFYNQKNYSEALPAWRYIFNNAPAFQLSTYTRGERIISEMLAKTKNVAYVDTLFMIYDQWIKYFGRHPKFGEGYALGKKGYALVRYRNNGIEDLKEAYGLMAKSFEMEGNKSHHLTTQTMFLSAAELYEANELAKEDFVNLYMKVSGYVEYALKNSSENLMPKLQEMKENVNKLFFSSGAADCETLNRLLTEKYNSAPDDLENLKTISSLLRRNECVELELFAIVAEKTYSLAPDADAAYSLANMFLKRQDYEKTEQYLKEAIEKSTVDADKADYYLRMAQLKLAQKQLTAAKSNLIQVLKFNPNAGSAYLLLAKAYAAYAPKYGEDNFEHASVYWVVVDKLQKAKQVDPSVASEANELIKTYRQHFPSKEDAFFRSVTEGTSVKIGDWINETTKARFTK